MEASVNPLEGSSGGVILEGVLWRRSPGRSHLRGIPSMGSTEVGTLHGVPGWAVGLRVSGGGLELVSCGVPWSGSRGGVLWRGRLVCPPRRFSRGSLLVGVP
jgi:hypothetical protein